MLLSWKEFIINMRTLCRVFFYDMKIWKEPSDKVAIYNYEYYQEYATVKMLSAV